jgi:hypothetical protein
MVTGEAVLHYIDRYILSDRYCIPMDKLDRAIQRSEAKFFDECDPGNSEFVFIVVLELMVWSVPVVVLFTKFDALVPVALGKLEPTDRRLPIQERLLKAKALTEGIFNNADIWGRLSRMRYPPKSFIRTEGLYYVFLYTYWVLLFTNMLGMHRSNEGCHNLLESTAAVLSDETLQLLFVSAQETNLALCIKCAAQQCVITENHLLWID